MKTIYKYKLEITDWQLIQLPYENKILHIAEQNGELFIWALVDTDAKVTGLNGEDLQFKLPVYIFVTGYPIKESIVNNCLFIGTVLMSNGLVWHVYADYTNMVL